MRVDRGTSRLVISVGKYAIKIAYGATFEHFLRGIVANICESKWRNFDSPYLSHIHCTLAFGLIAVHERVRPVKHMGIYQLDLVEGSIKSGVAVEFWLSDAKPSNYGYRGTQLVKIDYGD
jgi:hypothetical protein